MYPVCLMGQMESAAPLYFPERKRMDMEYSYSLQDVMERLPVRSEDSHKGSCGRVFLIVGSKNMCGAAYLAGKAAYRSGVGLVYIYTEECNRLILQQLLPEAVLITYTEDNWSPAELHTWLPQMDAVAVGSGLGQSEVKRRIVMEVLQADLRRCIFDADALNLLAQCKEPFQNRKYPVVITPHLKEMQRLSGVSIPELKQNLTEAACRFSKEHSVITVLKDAHTRVSDGGIDCYVNQTGNHGMATGGSGDVLTGVIAGLAAQGMDLFEAAKVGVYIHGMAGDLVKEQRGARSMMASEIADAVMFGIS